MYERFNDLKAKKPDLKTLLSLGGWNMGSEPFSQMVATPESRQKFAVNAISYLRARRFDGLDIDWEFPACRGSPPEDKQRFTLLLQVNAPISVPCAYSYITLDYEPQPEWTLGIK